VAGAPPARVRFAELESLRCAGWRVSKGEGLFPRPEPPTKT